MRNPLRMPLEITPPRNIFYRYLFRWELVETARCCMIPTRMDFFPWQPMSGDPIMLKCHVVMSHCN